MWTENLKNGKKRVCERYLDPLTGKQKTKCQIIEKDTSQGYKNAVYKLNQKIEKELSKQTVNKDLTFYELCDLFLSYKEKLVSETEIDTNEHKGTITEQRYIVQKSLMNVLKTKTENFYIKNLNIIIYNQIVEKINKQIAYHMLLNEIINFAYKQELIKSKNFVATPIPKKTKITDKFLEHDEVIELFNNDMDIGLRKLFEIMIETGMRIGELLALNIDDIKILKENNKIYYSIDIVKTYSSILKKITQNTKNKKSRIIGINKKTYDNLIFLKKLSNKKEIIDYKYNSILNNLKKIKLSTGKKITPHTFRHTNASILFEMGYDLETISDRLGDNSKTIKKIYLHIRKIRQKNEIKVFNKVDILDFENKK